MTLIDFKKNLCLKYPAFLGPGKGELDEIDSLLSQYGDGAIGILWANFRDDYEKEAMPRRPYFYKLADKLNLQKKTTAEATKYEQICYVCASKGPDYRFSIDLTTCPKCGNAERPRLALCRAGQYVSREAADKVLVGFPAGPWDPAKGSHHKKIQAPGEFLPGSMK